MFRKITSLLVVIIMVASLIPMQISAYNDEYENNDDQLVELSEAPGMMISPNSIQLMSASGNGKYQISVGTYLHVRSAPSTNGAVVGSLNNGDQVWIVETSGNWGRYDGGWISLNYAICIRLCRKCELCGYWVLL